MKEHEYCNDPKLSYAEKEALGCFTGRSAVVKKGNAPRHHRAMPIDPIGGGVVPFVGPRIKPGKAPPSRRKLPVTPYDPRSRGGKSAKIAEAGGGAAIAGGIIPNFKLPEMNPETYMQMEDPGIEMSSMLDGGGEAANFPMQRIDPYENLIKPDAPQPVDPSLDPIDPIVNVPDPINPSSGETFESSYDLSADADVLIDVGLDDAELDALNAQVAEWTRAQTLVEGIEGSGEGSADIAEFAADAVEEEVAGATAEEAAAEAALIGGEEAGITTGALAGGLALGPETLGASVLLGGAVAGLMAAFTKSPPNLKHPKANRIAGKDRDSMIKKLDKDPKNSGVVKVLRQDGPVFLVVLNSLDKKTGKHAIRIVHQLDTAGLAKAKATLELNPNAYKGVDVVILDAMGLSKKLTEGWNGTDNLYRLEAGQKPPTDSDVQKAKDEQMKLNKSLQAQSVWKKYQDDLKNNKYQGADRDSMTRKLLQWSWDHNLDPKTGKLLTPDQISKRGDRPSDFVPQSITGQGIIDKMQKKLAGDSSIELSQSEVRYLKSIGFDASTGDIGALYRSIQNEVMSTNLKKYSNMQDSDDKKYFYQSILRYAWEHNMKPTGGYLNPDEIRNKGLEPPKIPPDLQDQYDKDKSDYEAHKDQYNKDFQKYKDKLKNYSAFKDLRVKQQAFQNQVDAARNTGGDPSTAQAQLDKINQKISDAYDNMSV